MRVAGLRPSAGCASTPTAWLNPAYRYVQVCVLPSRSTWRRLGSSVVRVSQMVAVPSRRLWQLFPGTSTSTRNAARFSSVVGVSVRRPALASVTTNRARLSPKSSGQASKSGAAW
jgi:hypothetical protein